MALDIYPDWFRSLILVSCGCRYVIKKKGPSIGFAATNIFPVLIVQSPSQCESLGAKTRMEYALHVFVLIPGCGVLYA
jgi:hypothetical protein